LQLRLLTVGVFVVLGACDGRSAERSSGDSAAADIEDAAAGSPDSAALDAAQLVDAAPLADAAATDAAPVADAAARADAGPSWPLGMNDVTILTPLPASMTAPVLLRGSDVGQDGAPLVPKDLYDRLGGFACIGSAGSSACFGEPVLLETLDYEQLHLVAVRFDLCDRNLPGTCADGEDGRLRLVWQPMRSETFFDDAGLHAFFSIPNAQLPSALATLRELAQLQGAPVTSALAVSPGLSNPGKPGYAEGLRAFVRAYAQRAQLVRLALNAQPVIFSQVRWRMRGLERRADGVFQEMVIPGSAAVQQDVILRGVGYETTPAVDQPAGLAGVLTESVFDAASFDAKTTLVDALLAVDHPLKVAPDTTPCVACHTSTVLLEARAPGEDVQQQQLRGAYVTSHNVSITANRSLRTTRALGYMIKTPVISRRVAHETAQVLTEIERRFP
jgi:hypothetical protein